ncbi:MAG TPA: hypothetical protein VN894_12900, partial [Polyangiaceae bacterium]|nr:hypothetical protein [Polyangiaceae bacterium]
MPRRAFLDDNRALVLHSHWGHGRDPSGHQGVAMNRTSIDDEQPQRARQDEANGVRPGKRVRRPEGGQSFDLARMRELGRNLGGQLQAQARKRPYMMLGAAAGIGFV